ncbi:MAG TPA: methylated-DNA--[protein]-cysteine S-methyltransferase [Candidatus Tyrphobacter sp.]
MRRNPRPASLHIATPLGLDLEVNAADGCIVSSRFVRRRATPNAARVNPSAPHRVILSLSKDDAKLLREARRQVDAYFARKLVCFDLPLAFDGTAFESEVWRRVAALEFGEFVSYADVARAVGRPLAHRGVARAMGRSPMDLFIPAHRVVGADGKPRGLSPKGTRAKLIRFERAALGGVYFSGMPAKRWSKDVTEHSHALDLESDVFTLRSAAAIARSLKASAEQSKRRKGSAYQSAMSMLNFYINRAGKNLSPSRRQILERTKVALRKEFDRD